MTIEQIKEAIIQALEAGDTAQADKLEGELARLRAEEERQRERAALQERADRRKMYKTKAAELVAKVRAQERPIEHFLELNGRLATALSKLQERVVELQDLEKQCPSMLATGDYDRAARAIPCSYLPPELAIPTLGGGVYGSGITGVVQEHLAEARRILLTAQRYEHRLRGDVDLQKKLDAGEL